MFDYPAEPSEQYVFEREDSYHGDHDRDEVYIYSRSINVEHTRQAHHTAIQLFEIKR